MLQRAISRSFAPLAIAAIVFSFAACSSSGSDASPPPAPVVFSAASLPATAEAGEMLAIPVTGSVQKLEEGFFVRFTAAGEHVHVPPFRVEAGSAYVMVPPMPAGIPVTLTLVDVNGVQGTTHPETMTVATGVETTPRYTRASFDAALAAGFGALINMAIESLNTLESEGVLVGSSVDQIREGLEQQQTIMSFISVFNDNLDDGQLAMLQQLLDNMGWLKFLADAGGVSLDDTASQSSSLSSWWAAMVQSALLKSDLASMLIGECRGALNLLAWVMNQMSGWPIVGGWAQGVATWATGLSAQLQSTHDIINTMIPCDLVRITPTQSHFNLGVGQSANVTARGRFETEGPFNSQLFLQTVQQYTQAAATWLMSKMALSTVTAPYAQYVQQVAAWLPTWIHGWMTSSGLIQSSVMPGSAFTVLTIDNFNLDMAQYRFDIAGIVANLINLPYSAINAFFNWIGIGVGQPVGGFHGVRVVNGSVADYVPASDTLVGAAAGSSSAEYIGVICRPATGWWAQWGFYSIKTTSAGVGVTVN
jgi:hypothetical protein